MADRERRASDSSARPGRGRNRSDVGERLDGDTINEEATWSPELEPERPVLKTSESLRRPSTADSLSRRVSFRKEDLSRQPDGFCTAVAEEGLQGLFYKRHRGNTGSAERLVNFLYAKVLTDRDAAKSLQEPDIDKLRLHQSKLVDFIFGNDGVAPQPPGTDLRAVHRKMLAESGIGQEAWTIFVQHFEQEVHALKDVPEEHKAVALSTVQTTQQHFAAS